MRGINLNFNCVIRKPVYNGKFLRPENIKITPDEKHNKNKNRNTDEQARKPHVFANYSNLKVVRVATGPLKSKFLTMVHTHNHWAFGLCPSCDVVSSYKIRVGNWIHFSSSGGRGAGKTRALMDHLKIPYFSHSCMRPMC